MKRVFSIVLLIVLAVISGFYQEKLKVSVNYILEQGQKHPEYYTLDVESRRTFDEQNRLNAPFDYYHNHTTVSWLYRFDEKELSLLKWAITGSFIGWFLALNMLILKVLHVNENAFRMLPWIYLILTILSLAVYAAGMGFLDKQHCYAVSRKIMGALQSVIPAFVMWPAARLWDYSKSNDIS